jgi:hypothetical protein
MMAGANPAAVQRILRHRDPRITTEVYGHLAPGYLQSEVDRLQFGARVPDAVAADEIAEQRLAANAESDPFAAPVLQSLDPESISLSVDSDEPPQIPIDLLAPQWRRKQEPAARGFEPREETGTRCPKTAKTARSPANCSTSRPRARLARADRQGRTADAGGARCAFRTPPIRSFKHPLFAPASPSHPGAHCETGSRYPERPERTLASTNRAPSAR